MILSMFSNHSLERNVMETTVHHYVPVTSNLLAVMSLYLREITCKRVCVYNVHEPY
jgi:hypothetical protein